MDVGFIQKGYPMIGGVIIKSSRYANCFVAFPSFRSSKVIANAKTANQVRKIAIKKGFENPVILFVPPKNVVNIY